MSNNVIVLVKTGETTWKGITVHHGETVERTGRTLLAHYADPEEAAALVALGDLSTLGERLDPVDPSHSFEKPEEGTCVAYGRDRGEKGTEAVWGFSVEDVLKDLPCCRDVYRFNEVWTYSENYGVEFRYLAERLRL